MTLADLGNIGSLLGGAAGLFAVLAAIFVGSPGIREWRQKQASKRKRLDEKTREQQLTRRSQLQGWSQTGIHTYRVELVLDRAEAEQAIDQLTAGLPSEYVLLRVNHEGVDNSNRAESLRRFIETDGVLARPPTAGEREALEVGVASLAPADQDDWLNR